jgi:hypothetical protein
MEGVSGGSAKRGAGEVAVRFKNTLAEAVELFWNGQGSLHPMGEISARGARSYTSFVGHTWTAKRKSGDVLGEFVVAQDTVEFLVSNLKTEL